MVSLERKEGFTLIEIVISMILLSAVVAGMLAVFVVGRRSVGLAGHRVEALDSARQVAEYLKCMVGGYLWASGTPGEDLLDEGVDIPVARPLVGDLATLGGVRDYTVENVPTGSPDGSEYYKRVTIRVRWNEP